MEWFKMVIAFFVVCPLLVLFLMFFLFSKFNFKTLNAFGLAADVTTAVLFISVALLFKSIWGLNVYLLLFIAAIIIAIISTVVEWRKSKEIYIPQVLKRIWRLYFIILLAMYFVLMITGIIVYIVRFMS